MENLYVCISLCLWDKVEEYVLYTQKHIFMYVHYGLVGHDM